LDGLNGWMIEWLDGQIVDR